MREKGCEVREKGCEMREKGCEMREKGCEMREKGCEMREKMGEFKISRRHDENGKMKFAVKEVDDKKEGLEVRKVFVQDIEKKRVTKSNSLIEARYKLSINEQRLILLYISMLTPDLEDMPIIRLKVRDVVQALEIHSEKYYSELKEVLKKLRSRVLEIPTESGYIITGWIDAARYYAKKGEIVLRLSPELKPYLLKLKEAFTTYYLKNVLKLRSFYSIRLYELLKQYENVGRRRFALEDLRKILKIDDNKYKKYSDFKRFVILSSQKELQKKTDICFDFIELKMGRKVVGIEFLIKRNKKEGRDGEKEEIRREYQELLKKWKKVLEEINPTRLTNSQVIFFLENSLLELRQTIDAIKFDDRNPKVYNPVGVLMNTLPLRKNLKYFWLLKYEQSKTPILKNSEWYEEYRKKLHYAREILEKFQVDISLEPYGDPQTEEEAFKQLREIEMKIAKILFTKLDNHAKQFIKNQIKNLKDIELKQEIFTSLVLQKYGLKSINLYTV